MTEKGFERKAVGKSEPVSVTYAHLENSFRNTAFRYSWRRQYFMLPEKLINIIIKLIEMFVIGKEIFII